jgi:hypothetical protein
VVRKEGWGMTKETAKLVKLVKASGCTVEHGTNHLRVMREGVTICTFSQNIHGAGLVRIIKCQLKKNGVTL